MMTRERYCEFPSGNRVIYVEFKPECPKAITQIRQTQLNPEVKTTQPVWQPGPQKSTTSSQIQFSSTQDSVVTEFALPLQGQPSDYLEFIKLVYDESNSLGEPFNRLAAADQQLIDEFTNLSLLIECPQFEERMKDLNSDGIGLYIVEYTKFLQLICYHRRELEKLFNSYQKLIYKSRSLSELLNRCLTDIQQPINSNILENLKNCLVIQESEYHLGFTKHLSVKCSDLYQAALTTIIQVPNFTQASPFAFNFLPIFVNALELLRTTKDNYSVAYQRILWFRNIIQELLENYSAALGKTNDIQ
jgi:hypothetical protein